MMQGEKDLQNLLSIYAILWDNKKRNMRETVQGEENSNYETKIMMTGILAMSMVFAACGSGASTEVEQEDTEVIQEETPEAEDEPEVTRNPGGNGHTGRVAGGNGDSCAG